MRAFAVTAGIFVFTHAIDFLGWHDQVEVLFHLDDTGTLPAIREVMLLLLLVQLADWVFLPKVSLKALILGTDDMVAMPKEVRAATIRGWFTFVAAVCIAVALISYT